MRIEKVNAGIIEPRAAYACTLAPEVSTGPPSPPRRDLGPDGAGVPLMLRLRVLDANTCVGLEGVILEVRHCDAYGRHPSFHHGAQATDARGYAEFRTLFPGWYANRAVHVQVRAHTGHDRLMHTGQLYFEEPLTRDIAALTPYRENPTPRATIGQDPDLASGAVGLLTVVPRDRYRPQDGLLGRITVAVDPHPAPAPALPAQSPPAPLPRSSDSPAAHAAEER